MSEEKGKKCVGCGKYHYNYGGTVLDLVQGGNVIIDMKCNLCGTNNGSYAVNRDGTSVKLNNPNEGKVIK